ncbi:DUF4369 domain-containing protein [Bacteroides caecigallinarum]|uniref:DUF4369 domain-containing protein n=1 Tax=Bacteroides TaxID=816 RepID=UPI00195ED60B|nr:MULTISPECIES: DUF4369 domain-containing protein [Bacteroides]MBM6960533.1 DUF4369 domain-containing protein [Bacteroides caecigallinarum]MCF2737730.1 DUF4369 domain-containing protein [Bacteroides caecigallinarum]MDN0072002.1 DUF4369 domain-containing protein [Bacteroides caecigallinarum]
MYRFCFVLLFITTLVSCGKKYKVDGVTSVSRLDGKMLFIKVVSGDQLVSIDSAEVIHGYFSMNGKVDSVVLASLYMDDECIMPLVLEEGNINIEIDNVGISIKGTPLNDSFNKFIEEKTAIDDKAYEVEREESRMIMDGIDINTVQAEIDKQRASVGKQMDNLVKTFIQTNYENVLGPGVFIMIGNSLPYPFMTPLMKDIVDEAPEVFKNNYLVKNYITLAGEYSEQPLQ